MAPKDITGAALPTLLCIRHDVNHAGKVDSSGREFALLTVQRWPLLLRFIKGAIHGAIVVHVICHAIFTALIVCLHTYVGVNLDVPGQIVGSPQGPDNQLLTTTDPIPLYCRWSIACISQPDIIQPFLGWQD